MSMVRLLDFFNARALRERVLIAGCALALLLACWDGFLMQPLRDAVRDLQSELSSATEVGTTGTDDDSDPHRIALRRAGELQLRSDQLDAQLIGSARHFVPAAKMIEVLHDVLRRQDSLSLVSIRNLPVRGLVTPSGDNAIIQPPFVHSIELVIDGRYGDIQNYVRELETLQWKFRWSLLDLSTRQYPMTRVRLSLSTLSMDSTWLGVATS
jgi:MSHA biogenesis protein MshJ